MANEKDDISKGRVLKLTGLPDDLKWKTLRTVFNKYATVAYADYQKGQTEATLRFVKENGAKLALAKAVASNVERKVLINGKEISARVLDGEEEKLYWKEFYEYKEKNKDRFIYRGKKSKSATQDGDSKNNEPQKKEEKEEITKGCVLKLTGLPDDLDWETLRKFFNEYSTVEYANFQRTPTVEDEMIEGCVLKVTGLPDDLKWETLRKYFNEFSTVAYADCRRGQNEAILRFAEENGAKLALQKALASNKEKKLIINGKVMSARVLDGEEEKAYWKEFSQYKAINWQRFAYRGKKSKLSENMNGESRKIEVALLRFANENGAKLALEKALASNKDRKLIINNKEVSAKVVEGEEEKSYWRAFLDFRARNRQRFAFRESPAAKKQKKK